MSTPRNDDIPREIEDALALFFDNQATPAVCQAIHDWLEEDALNAAIFAEYATIERMIYTAQKTEDASAVFALLQEAEENAQPTLVTIHDSRDWKDPGLSIHQWHHAAAYLLRHSLMNRRVEILASAAVVLVGVILAIVVLSTSEQFKPIAKQDEQRAPQSQESPVAHAMPIVAALTGEHHAEWDLGPAPKPLTLGSPLQAGERLTLTKGFAQITTQRGAVAILEAPCTIELIDSPNALRLHSGKLVGVCLTESSKGFLVRTPHMDVTDLGTRFGVRSSEQGSGVRVIEGEVEIRSLRAELNQAPTYLTAGQHAVTLPGDGAFVIGEHPPNPFVHDWQSLIQPPTLTGVIRYEPSAPIDLRFGADEAEEVRLYLERCGVALEPGLNVNITMPGHYQGHDLFKTKPLQGLTVDSYFVHFDISDDSGAVFQRRVTIRFDRPVVGIITASQQLADSHPSLGLHGVAYGNQSVWPSSDKGDSSGLDVSQFRDSAIFNDAVQLSEDRQSVTLDLKVTESIDQVRILVESSNPSE